jgi:catechol 2,3-dioxygenase-like lactoylglutathione lyase family enzyme
MTFGFIAPATDDTFSFEIMGGPGAAPRPAYQELGDSYNLQGWNHTGIRVDDVDATVAELKQRGVKIVSEPPDVEVMKLRLLLRRPLGQSTRGEQWTSCRPA